MLMTKRDTALKKAIKSGLQQDRLLFNSLRNKIVKTLRQAKAQFFVNILNETKGNSKRVWQTINKLMKKDIKSCNKCLELDFKGSIIDKPDEIADVFNNYFVDSVKNWSDKFGITYKEINSVNLVKPAFHLTIVTECTIQDIIKDFKNYNAKDIDGLL